jgi:hypothetical protein
MNLRTFICEPFVDVNTFEKSYQIQIYEENTIIYSDVNHIWPDIDESSRINFLNMILDHIKQPPLTKEEIFLYKLTKDYQ